jgi:hypothetical protein
MRNKLILLILFILAQAIISCSGGDDSGNDPGSNPNGGGNGNLDSRLVCGAGEGWQDRVDDIYVFRANGTYSVFRESQTGSSWQVFSEGTWLTEKDSQKDSITINCVSISNPYCGTQSYVMQTSIELIVPCNRVYANMEEMYSNNINLRLYNICGNNYGFVNFNKVVGLPSSVK